MNKLLSNILKFILFVGIGATILVVLYRKLNASYQAQCITDGIPLEDCSLIDKVWSDFQNSSLLWLGIVLLCYMISNISRSYRWKYLIDSLGYKTRLRNVFHSTMLLYFANLGFPRMGEFVRAGSIARYEKIPFEKLMGTAIVDRIFDMLSFLLVFLLAFALEYDTIWNFIVESRGGEETTQSGTPWLMILIVFAAAVAGVAYWKREVLRKLPLVEKAEKLIVGFLDGVKSVRKLQNVPGFIFHSVVIWVMYFLMTYFCFSAFEPTAHLGAKVGLMAFVFGSLGMIIPSPGGMGSYHALVVAALVLYGVAQADAFSFAMIIFFTINIFGNILFGIIAMIALPLLNRNYEPQITST